MKAPAFSYAKPRELSEAFELLERHGERARVLAGGQSLIPSLNMRLSSPEILVDIGALPLRGIAVKGQRVTVGALTTHAEIEASADIRKHVPLLAEAVKHVAHPAIRNRGTLGGSLALADPAAEYPAVAVALDATIVLQGRKGERRVQAKDFFKGLFETDLRPGEILTAAEFPILKAGEKCVFLELARRHGDYAIVGLAAFKGAETRFVFMNVGPIPVVASKADELDPTADLYNSAATKRHLAGVLMERAWKTLSTSR